MKKNRKFSESIRDVLLESLEKDERVVVLGENLEMGGRYGVTAGLKEKFGSERIIETPLIEDMLVGIGLGAAIGGLRPVVEFMHPTLALIAYAEMYVLGIWRYRVLEPEGPPLIVRIPFGGFDYGRGPEMSGSFLGAFQHIPGISLVVPSTPQNASSLLRHAFLQKNPVLFFEHKALYWTEGEVDTIVKKSFGKADVISWGDSFTIISCGYLLKMIVDAKEKFARRGFYPEIIDLNTIVPLDKKTILQSVLNTKKVLIVEEDMLRGGVGAEIAAFLAEDLPGIRIKRVAAKNVPLLPGDFEKNILPSLEDIFVAADALLKSRT